MRLSDILDRLRSIVTRPARHADPKRFSLGSRPERTRAGPAQRGGPAAKKVSARGDMGRAPGGTTGQPGGRTAGGPGGAETGSAGGRTAPGTAAARRGTGVAAGGLTAAGGAWPGQEQKPGPLPPGTEAIPKDIERAFARLAEIFHFPDNKDIIFRKFALPTRPLARAFLLYIEGLCDSQRVEREVLFPLMHLPKTGGAVARARLPVLLLNTLLPAGSAERKHTVEELVAGAVLGEVAIVLEGGIGVLVDVKTPPSRHPSQPATERTTRGPNIGFVESHRFNTAMIRYFIHDPDLMLEDFTVGRRTKTPVSVMYIRDIANPKVVAEVRRRLNGIDIDGLVDSGVLEKLIEDRPSGVIPTVLTTERPDRVANHILQGSVGILVGGSTRALVVPVTYSTFLHSGEDPYLRYVYASFLRVLRLAAVVLALLLPGLYVAISNYHQEVLPGLLLLTFTASRESVPFPTIVSVVFLEASFELIREAGIRIPTAIGPTIGIVGALLIGDMAVRSALVSPITVIVVAITALANYAMPEMGTAWAARVGRFVFIALGGVLGLYGIAIGLFAFGIHVANVKSFGVPFLAPIGPWWPGSPDVILRGPITKQDKRPVFLRPLDLIRQARYVRAWDPLAQTERKGGGGRPGSTGRSGSSGRAGSADRSGATGRPGSSGNEEKRR